MSAFTPDVPPIPRPSDLERLGRFVPAALRRTPPVAKLWGLPRLVVTGLATAGFLPAFALHGRVRKVLMLHAQQCERAADLLAEVLPADDAAVVRDAALRVRQSQGWTWLARLIAAVSLGCAVAWLATTYESNAVARLWAYPISVDEPLLVTATLLLTLAYLLAVVPINRQLLRMQQFALAFNATAGERVGDVDPPPLVWGMKPGHLVVGGVLAVCGPVWALPMCVAWAAHGQFATRSALRFRVRLAERLQDLTGVDTVVPRQDLCPNPDCRGPLPATATFCPRCGAPTARTAVPA